MQLRKIKIYPKNQKYDEGAQGYLIALASFQIENLFELNGIPLFRSKQNPSEIFFIFPFGWIDDDGDVHRRAHKIISNKVSNKINRQLATAYRETISYLIHGCEQRKEAQI
jgi:hypothetical protein